MAPAWSRQRSPSMQAKPAPAAGVQREAFDREALDSVSYVTDLWASLASEPGLFNVAIDEDKVVGHALFAHNLLDAPRQLVDVQVLSATTPDSDLCRGIALVCVGHRFAFPKPFSK